MDRYSYRSTLGLLALVFVILALTVTGVFLYEGVWQLPSWTDPPHLKLREIHKETAEEAKWTEVLKRHYPEDYPDE